MKRNKLDHLVVGVGEYKITDDPSDTIKTYALGSCVAIIAYDEKNKVAGMMHIALPDAKVSLEKSKILPGYFVDSGIPVFLDDMKKHGAIITNLKIKIVGGANIADKDSYFDIGRRNVIAIRKLLWQNNLAILAEDIGSNFSRTVSIDAKTGEINISSRGNKWTI